MRACNCVGRCASALGQHELAAVSLGANTGAMIMLQLKVMF